MKTTIHPSFSHVGTWSQPASICKTCGEHNQILMEPLQIEWDAGSADIGDFSWCSYTAIVLDHVRDWFTANQFEVQFGRTEVLKPTLKTHRMPRVAFPYVGPKLHWLISTAQLRLDEQASGIEAIPDCPVCGQTRTKFTRQNIVIPKANWRGEKIFQILQHGKSGAKFVTEEALVLLRAKNFSNYRVVPAGAILD